jgi:hypothetical protein
MSPLISTDADRLMDRRGSVKCEMRVGFMFTHITVALGAKRKNHFVARKSRRKALSGRGAYNIGFSED